MTPLRIAMVLHAWPAERAGGTGMVVGALSEALIALGHRVCVLAPSAAMDPAGAADTHVEEHGLTADPPRSWPETWSHPELDHEFDHFLRHWQPDIVHIHHLSGLSMGMITAARRRGIRVVLCLHDYAIPCIRGQLITHDEALCEGPRPETCALCMEAMSPAGPRLASLARPLLRIPGVERGGRALLSRLPRRTSPLRAHAQTRISAAKELLLSVDRLEAPSEDLCNRMEGMGLPRPVLAPLPLVHPIEVAPAPPAHLPPQPPRFLFVGSLIPTKGPLRLLQAFAELSPGSATLTLVGASPPYFGSTAYGDEIRARIRSIAGASLLAPVSSSEMSHLLHSHDVLILPSTWPENSPLVIREATAAGLRTVWSAIGGASELDPRGRSVSPSGIEPLVHALQEEVNLGRLRHPPIRWPAPTEVAEWHIVNSYSSCGDDETGTIRNLSH